MERLTAVDDVLAEPKLSGAIRSLEGRTVLVVEDDPVMFQLYEWALKSRGVVVIAAGSAEDARIVAATQPIDLALVDYELPGMSGVELVRSFRQGEMNMDLPIVMVSGHGNLAERVRAYEAGVTDYVVKPVQIVELVAKLGALLQHGDALRMVASGVTHLDTTDALARLEGREWRSYFQPIFSLRKDRLVGYEALTRFHDGTPPDQCFESARRSGVGVELELATLEDAFSAAAALDSDAWLSVNVSPSAVVRRDFAKLVHLCPRQLVIELTESEAIDDHARVREALGTFPAEVRLAIDDAGAGWAGLQRMVELRPKLVKLDRALVTGADRDPTRRAMIAGLRHYAAETDAELLAEGIELPAELATMVDLGVDLGQGFLLGRPAPIG